MAGKSSLLRGLRREEVTLTAPDQRTIGLEIERFMEVLRPSALYAPTVDKKLERMLSHQYGDPNFSTSLLRKDLRLFLREAQLAGVNASALQGLATLLESAEGTDLDSVDYCALHELTAGR